ncbi:hypothetical protein PROCH_1862 [Prochlorococcus marinus str. EQPAC1]|nr:hypothetical protein PROCH_1862 [Prochlorococcus marinus str. EQPAC1]
MNSFIIISNLNSLTFLLKIYIFHMIRRINTTHKAKPRIQAL